MTDILLGPDNDLFIENGQLVLIDSVEVLVRQRLLNKLRTITGTLFTNIDYGIDRTLLFKKGTKDFLDQNIQSLIDNTTGVIQLLEFESSVNLDREYVLKFKYEIETGEIVGISGLSFNPYDSGVVAAKGIWLNGYWDYSGVWDKNEVWGENPDGIIYAESIPLDVAIHLRSFITTTKTNKGYDVEFLVGDGPGYFTMYISVDTVPGGTYLVSGDLLEGGGLHYLTVYPDDDGLLENITGKFNFIITPDREPIQFYLNYTGTPDPLIYIKDLNIQLLSITTPLQNEDYTINPEGIITFKSKIVV